MSNAEKLWLPSSYHDRQEYKKAPPPKLGPSHGAWGGDANSHKWLTLPGGAVLQFDLSKLTLGDYRTMRNHYQINATMSVLLFTMHQLDWWIECEDRKIAQLCEENLRETWTRLIRAITQAYWAGFSPIALEYENDNLRGRIKINKFKDLIPEQCFVNWKSVKGAVPAGAGPGAIRPERKIFDGIKQVGEAGHIPVDHSLWYPVLMENGDMRGRKLLKPAFAPYFFSQLIHLFTNRYFERFGEPLVVGRAPFDQDLTDSEGNTKSGRDATIDMIMDLRNRSAVVLPNDRTMTGNGDQNDFEYSLDFLETQLRGVDYDRYIKTLDEEMSLAMFVPVLLFRTADVGSYNLGQAHERTFFYQMNALAGDLAEYLNRYVLNRLVDYNFTPNAPRAKFVYRKMGKDRDETLRAILQSSIQQKLMMPDLEELGMAVGMQMHEIKQVTNSETGELQPSDQRPVDDPDLREPNFPARDPKETANTRTSIRPHTSNVIDGAASRLLSQLAKGGREGYTPDAELGYKRKMWEAQMLDGVPDKEAEANVRRAYGVAQAWLDETLEYGSSLPQEIADTVGGILTDQLA